MKKDWLYQKVTVAEAEAAHMVNQELLGSEPIPFGFENQEWQSLLSEMLDGDELWEFNSPFESWKHLAGRAGICLVRKGQIIRSIVTIMN
jgi:hypothetical protein